jgi:hypothetical protein
MTQLVFNVAKGRMNEWAVRVDSNDPANSAIILVPLSASSTSEAVAQDMDDLTEVLAGAATEQTAGGWKRGTLTDTELATPAADNTNNRFALALPQFTWTGPTAGNNTTGLLVCYDSDTTAGTDASILPISEHDFAVTADGNDVILNAGDAVRCS